MKKEALAIFSLCVTLFLLHVYGHMKDHFYGPHRFEKQLMTLRNQVEDERFGRRLAEHQLLEFKTEVARLLPETGRGLEDREAGYPLRKLASVVSRPDTEKLRESLAQKLFQKGKDAFRARDYALAAQSLDQFIKKYSYSVHVTEAFFLKAESHFLQQDFESCARVVEQMLRLYPEAELTGYALLRLGKIYEFQDRPEEAVEIYKTVLKSFPYRGLATQAQNSLGAVDL